MEHLEIKKMKFINEEEKGYSFQEAINEAKRCLNCKKPLCRTGCPISNNIPDFIHALSKGNLGSASEIIAQRSNLPAVCGRVCPHERQCEGSCILAKKGNGIKIGKLERFIADMDSDYNLVNPTPLREEKGKVAVIGSGPAGLTVAGDLAKAGMKVDVYDGLPEPGGVLMYGIPEFRLPKDVVRREVVKLEKLGVTFKNLVTIGKDKTIDDLENEGYDAIFIGTGNSNSKTLPVDGNDLAGVIQATDFLKDVEMAHGDKEKLNSIINSEDEVIVVGGGNTAIDAARTAIRIGAKNVTIVYRRRCEDMPALKSEIDAAIEEGVIIKDKHGPLAILGEDKVETIATVERRFDEENNQVVDTDVRVDFPATKILLAIGQMPSDIIVSTTTGIEVDSSGFVKTRKTPYGMTTRHGIFSGGDVVTGPATVVMAMKDAQMVAKGIIQYVEAKKLMKECGLKIEV